MGKPSYRTRKRFWAASSIMVSSVPLLLIVGIMLFQFYGSFHEKVIAHLEELVGKHRQNIDSFLASKLGDIKILVRTFNFEELSHEEFLQQRLAILHSELDPFIVDLGVINSKGIQTAYAGPFRLEQADYSTADWFNNAMQHEYFVSDVFRGLRGLPHFIIAVRGIWQGEPWILRATIDFVAFSDLVENIRIGETGFAFILNGAGEFQTRPSPDFKLDPERSQELLGLSEQVHVLERPDGSKGKIIYVTAPLKNGKWLLVYQQSTADALSDYRNIMLASMVILLFGLAAIVAAAYFLARKMVAHIEAADREKQMMNKQIVETGKLASVGELAAGIAHEINNPVAIMVEEAGWIQDLMVDIPFDDPDKLEEFDRALQQIRNQGTRCKQITHKLLSFARKTDTRITSINLHDLVEEMVALSAQRAKYQNVDIRTDLQSGLPEIHGAISELQQVMLNLINNALDAMEKGGGKITISAHREDERIAIHIADTGPGIPEANLGRIFDPFFTTKPVGKGTGLGLSICFGIITKMGGTINARSVVGAGTTFRILLPTQKERDEEGFEPATSGISPQTN